MNQKLDRTLKSLVICLILYFWACQIQPHGLLYVLQKKATNVLGMVVNALIPVLQKCGGTIAATELPNAADNETVDTSVDLINQVETEEELQVQESLETLQRGGVFQSFSKPIFPSPFVNNRNWG